MNIILLQPGDFFDGRRAVLNDRRAKHIREVLKPFPGQSLRIGLLNGPRGTGEVVALNSGDGTVELACTFEDTAPPAPPVDLLLALPRPKVMKRLWAPLASLGVGHIYLTNAEKVERNYFDSTVLQSERYEALLREGLEQAGDTHMPGVSIHRRLKIFLEDECPDYAIKQVAHPGPPPVCPTTASGRTLLAIGPEGGWSDYERTMFEELGFDRFGMGARILRSDIACIAALARYLV